MDRFTELRIDGYRRLCNIALPLRPLNVVIGANGAGKTSLLEAIHLLKAAARGQLADSISDLQGFSSILCRGACRDQRTIDLGCAVVDENGVDLQYRLALRESGTEYRIASEWLAEGKPVSGSANAILNREGDRFSTTDTGADGERLAARAPMLQPTESALSQLRWNLDSASRMRALLGAPLHCGALDVGPRAPVRLPQALRAAPLPGINGENLAGCLYTLREANPDAFENVEDALRAAFPRFQRLAFPSVATGMLTFTWQDANFSDPLYPHELSGGTLRFLWLVTLLSSPGLPPVTLIDEPEASLHPELLSILAELLREAEHRAQIVVATQSDSLVRFLHPGEVVVMDVDESGLATATNADELDLDRWLRDYTLDELWRMGQMGGKAW